MSQKAAVIAILDAGIAAGHSDKALRAFAIPRIAEGLMDGRVPHTKGNLDDKAAKSYAGALVSNYLKKEANYNEGVPYADRKGVRGPRVKDAELTDLTTSLASLEAQPAAIKEHYVDLIARTKAAIDARKAFLASQKAQPKEVIPLDDAVAKLTRLLQPTG